MIKPLGASRSKLLNLLELSSKVKTVDLSSIDDDHEREGQLMADSIVAWLDDEWIPQQVHVDIADFAKTRSLQFSAITQPLRTGRHLPSRQRLHETVSRRFQIGPIAVGLPQVLLQC